MKRVIRSSSDRLRKFSEIVTVPRTNRRYRIKGQIDEYGGLFFAEIIRIAAYDDADYWWARANGGGLIEFIKDNKVQKTIEFKEFDDDVYETVQEYMDDMIDEALKQVDRLNDSVSPKMMYN